MGGIIGFLITALVTAIALLIMSRALPFLGVDIDSPGKALVSGLVFGVLNALIRPLLTGFGLFTILTLGLASLVANIIIFGLAAFLVPGFRLRKGFLSAILGAIALSIITFLINQLLSFMGLVSPVG